MWIMRHHDRLPSNRTAVTPLPPSGDNSLYGKPLTASSDRATSAAFASGIRVAARRSRYRGARTAAVSRHPCSPARHCGRTYSSPLMPATGRNNGRDPRPLNRGILSRRAARNSSNARSNALDAPSRRNVRRASCWRGFSAARLLPARVAEHTPTYASPLLRSLRCMTPGPHGSRANTLPVFPAHARCERYSKNHTRARREPAESHAARFRNLTLSVWPSALRARE